MPQFLVLTLEGDDVPALGNVGNALVYRGDHANAADAVVGASEQLDATDGKRLWAVQASALIRYRNTTTVSRTAAVE